MIELIGLLEHLDIKPHKTLANHHSGSIRRHSAGNSEDFLRFKHYANGDSLNRIDWRRYAKDKGILTKVFGDEINFDITIAIDTSASMACFEKRKVRYQQRLAEAIAYNALYHGRQVTLIDMGLENHQTMGGECHQGIAKVSKWLETRD
ncbi:MAG: DUF58 domain-containing protein, partial [Clostridia bacterium]|nr:DUF58 domain-containing protein [Clostridia bacterium]